MRDWTPLAAIGLLLLNLLYLFTLLKGIPS
jgi:hypothetical protein